MSGDKDFDRFVEDSLSDNREDLAHMSTLLGSIALVDTNSITSPIKISDAEVCAVCLSPLVTAKLNFYSAELEDRLVVKTKCQHTFHKLCLDSSKLRKCECPMCRTQLTPVTTKSNSVDEVIMMRENIARAAQRGRDAVRRAWATSHLVS